VQPLSRQFVTRLEPLIFFRLSKEDTVDYKETSDKIEAVLNSVLPELDDHRDGDILVDWVVVAYVTNPDEDEKSAYPMLFSNGRMPTYRAMGLLRIGQVSMLNDLDLGE